MILLGTLNRLRRRSHKATINWHAERAIEGMRENDAFPTVPRPRSGDEDVQQPAEPNET